MTQDLRWSALGRKHGELGKTHGGLTVLSGESKGLRKSGLEGRFASEKKVVDVWSEKYHEISSV